MSCRTALHEKPPVAQLHIQFPVFYTTRQFITIFTTASLTPSHLTSLAHPPSALTYILQWTTSLLQPTRLVHFKHNADKPKWGTKKVTHWQIKESLIQCTDLKMAQITPNAVPTSNLTNLILNYIINMFLLLNLNNQTKMTITNTSPTLSCLYWTGTTKTLT